MQLMINGIVIIIFMAFNLARIEKKIDMILERRERGD